MTLLLELVVVNLINGELLPFDIGLTACRRFLNLHQGKLRLSLDQRQTSPRLLHYCARPTFVFIRPVVFLQAASKPLLNVVNTTHFKRFLFTPYLVA